jgi:hypothetical protein
MAIIRITTGENSLPRAGSGILDAVNSMTAFAFILGCVPLWTAADLAPCRGEFLERRSSAECSQRHSSRFFLFRCCSRWLRDFPNATEKVNTNRLASMKSPLRSRPRRRRFDPTRLMLLAPIEHRMSCKCIAFVALQNSILSWRSEDTYGKRPRMEAQLRFGAKLRLDHWATQ